MLEEKSKPKVNVKFIFSMCNDVVAMRHFYTELLGMQEQAFFNQKDFSYISYICRDGLYLMFFYSGKETPKHTEWAWQPGYDGGSLHIMSLAIEIPEGDFANTVERLKKENVKIFSDTPDWRQNSYWGFTIMDPQGNTLELFTMPKEKPSSTTWPGK
jgi:catechol 2,3-dioxygenase-like lactoylglutathione lyase family enzyme